MTIRTLLLSEKEAKALAEKRELTITRVIRTPGYLKGAWALVEQSGKNFTFERPAPGGSKVYKTVAFPYKELISSGLIMDLIKVAGYDVKKSGKDLYWHWKIDIEIFVAGKRTI